MNILHFLFIAIAACVLSSVYAAVKETRDRRRETYIREFPLPKGLMETLLVQHPHLTHEDCELVAQGLRQFFLVHLRGCGRLVSMPSRVVDDLWHEFILYTRAYEQFCRNAYGCTLHHNPAIVLTTRHQGSQGIRRTWKYACAEENIDSRAPDRLPLLFELDSKLAIANGFTYMPDCSARKAKEGSADSSSAIYCGAELGNRESASDVRCDDIDVAAEGDSDAGCGAGCGGCGGGCGGGGD